MCVTQIFGKGKKSVDHPEHGMEETPLPEWLWRYSLQPMRRGSSKSFLFFCVSITPFPFSALLFIMAQCGSAAHTPQIATHSLLQKKKLKNKNSRPSIPPHHLHLTFCVASNSYDNIFAPWAPSPPPCNPPPS